MAEFEPKKLLILYILNILREHTDPDHPISQQKIVEHLESEYGMTADRKTVRRNLSKLMEAGYPIRQTERPFAVIYPSLWKPGIRSGFRAAQWIHKKSGA